MVRVYESHEIPQGYKYTIRSNGIDLDTVEYVVNADYGNHDSQGYKVAEKLGNYIGLGTITDDWIYVVIK